MTANDNRTVADDYFRSLHPQMTHLPDYGLSKLDPEDDARFRALAEEHGVDYDQLKKDFCAMCQVVPERPRKMSLALMDKNAIPLNALKGALQGAVLGAIGSKRARDARRKREEAAQSS